MIAAHGVMANFFIPQAEYLAGTDCSDASVRFVCTETFEDDWARVVNGSDDSMRVGALHRNARGTRGELAMPASNRTHRAVFAPGDARTIRECLYPWDEALHKAVCRDSRE